MGRGAGVKSFVYESKIPRVVFGAGSFEHLEREVDLLGARKVLVLSTPEQRGEAEKIAGRLGARCAGVYDKAVMHVPVESARPARELARSRGADCALAIGGGSTIGLAKVLALDPGLPILAIPTTYAGSEMTTIYDVMEGGLKQTNRHPAVLPRTVIYDPLLTLGLPKKLSVTSGMNAIAHAVEGLYAKDANPITSAMAEDGIRAFAQSLLRIVKDPQSVDARSECLYGAWLCGAVLGAVSMGLHHKLCHVLGGSFDLPHAETHSIVLPHAVAYNNSAAPAAMARIERALQAENAAAALYDLATNLGAPVALRQIGMRALDLDRAAEIATATPVDNPRPVDRRAVRSLLDEAFHGHPPMAQSSARRRS
jgi:maleylacetate reductase